MAGEPLYMVQLRLDPARVFELARQQRLPLREVDHGYLVHCHLRRLFTDFAPQPFSLPPARGRWLTVLGYTEHEPERLIEQARMFAEPEVYAACDWESFAGKKVPGSWSTGQQLGFEVRLCPVVRMASEGPKHRKGAEVDAFLARCWAVGDPHIPVSREKVYQEWLTERLAPSARVMSVSMTRFSRQRLLRRNHEAQRRSALCERPDATLAGELTVEDGPGFQALLGRGIGRHRAFGFGMLLLRPGKSRC